MALNKTVGLMPEGKEVPIEEKPHSSARTCAATGGKRRHEEHAC
jgi:hypothetical protein